MATPHASQGMLSPVHVNGPECSLSLSRILLSNVADRQNAIDEARTPEIPSGCRKDKVRTGRLMADSAALRRLIALYHASNQTFLMVEF